MSDWIRKKADAIKKREREAAETSESKRQEESVVLSTGKSVLPKLAEAFKRDISTWNDQFPGEESRHLQFKESPTSGLHIEGRAGSVNINFAGGKLEVRFVTPPQVPGQQAGITRSKIHMHVDKDQQIFFVGSQSMMRISYDDASQRLIDAVI